jgi:hypothetical protein
MKLLLPLPFILVVICVCSVLLVLSEDSTYSQSPLNTSYVTPTTRNLNAIREEQSPEYLRDKMMQEMATQGVQLRRYGELLRFSKAYETILVLPLPFQHDFDLPLLDCALFDQSFFVCRIDPNDPHCTDPKLKSNMVQHSVRKAMHNPQPIQLNNQSTQNDWNNKFKTIRNKLRANCIKLHNEVVRVKEMLIDRKKDTKQFVRTYAGMRSPTRSRRDFGIVSGPTLLIGLGLAAGTYMYSQHAKINSLQTELNRLTEATQQETGILKSLTNEEGGVISIIDARTERLSKGQEVIAKQLNEIQIAVRESAFISEFGQFEYVSLLIYVGEMEKQLASMMSLVEEYLLEEILKQGWEESILSLRSGLLPYSLIRWPKLRDILNQIEQNVKSRYDLAISNDQWHYYYYLPLTGFTVHKDKLVIRLSVPLTDKDLNIPVMNSLYQPTFHPVPCEFCLLNGSISFAKIEESNKLLVEGESCPTCSPSNTKRQWLTASWEDLHCLPLAEKHVCYSFQKLLRPSACMSGLIETNITRIRSQCHFVPTEKSEYSPIQYREGAFIVHTAAINSSRVYIVVNGKRVQERHLTGYANAFKLPPGTDVHTGEHILRGPQNMLLRDFPIEVSEKKGVLSNITLLKHANTNTFNDLLRNEKFRGEEIEKRLTFNLTTFRLQFNQRNDSFAEVMQDIRHAVSDLEKNTVSTSNHESHLFLTTLTILISLSSYLFQCITAILFLSFIIRDGNWRFFAPPAVTINLVDRVDAELLNVFQLSANNVINMNEYLMYAQVAFVLFMFMLIIFTFVMKSWGKVHLMVHEGVAEIVQLPYQRFVGRISFSIVRQTLTSKYDQLVQITFPLGVEVPNEASAAYFSVDQLHIFSVGETKSTRSLKADRDLRVRFVNSQGYWIEEQENNQLVFIEIPLGDITWVKGGKPVDLQTSFYSRATLTILPDSRDLF